jgi:hypothetical protein
MARLQASVEPGTQIAPRLLLAKGILTVTTSLFLVLFYLSARFAIRVGGMIAEELPIRELVRPTLICVWHNRTLRDAWKCFLDQDDVRGRRNDIEAGGQQKSRKQSSSPGDAKGDRGAHTPTTAVFPAAISAP